MLGTKDIEELATGAVKRYFNTCPLISPQIQENDKTPDWDGFLALYKTKKDVRNNYIGRLGVQVKGKEVTKFKEKETFSIEKIFLNNARNEGFIFFVVEVKEDETSKIFYKKMAPIEIRKELSTFAPNGKTRSMSFEPLSMDKSLIEIQLMGFQSDCIKQSSFASSEEFNIENLKNANEYEWTFSFQGNKANFTEDWFNGFKTFLYAKTKDGYEIPVGNGPMTVKIPELNVDYKVKVIIDNEVVCDSYEMIKRKEDISYKLHDLLIFTSETNSSTNERKSTIEVIANSTKQQIRANEIYKKLVEYGSIIFGNNNIEIKVTNKAKLISNLEERISELRIHQTVLDYLNVKIDIDYSIFTHEDNFSINQLYKALIEHKPIGLSNPKPIFKLTFANINVLLTCTSDNNGKYFLENAFSSSLIQVSQGSNEDSFQVPVFSYLEEKGYIIFDNIPYGNIVSEYDKYAAIDSRTITQANLNLLEMLKATDELKLQENITKSAYTLNAADQLSKWILSKNQEDEMINIHIINCMQIIKRQRKYNDDELSKLKEIANSGTTMIKAAAYLLLDNLSVFQYIFNSLSQEEQEQFMDFPIYTFAIDKKIDSSNIKTK